MGEKCRPVVEWQVSRSVEELLESIQKYLFNKIKKRVSEHAIKHPKVG